MPSLLLVDDDRFLLRALQKLLAAEGWTCRTAATAWEAGRILEQPAGEPISLVVLDVGLPDQDGFSFCRRLRKDRDTPVLFLTARQDVTDKVVGLELGADDYVTKPFEPRELVARIRALLRRVGSPGAPAAEAERIPLGEITLALDLRDALRGDRPLGLTAMEFELLQFLSRHPDRALAAEWIFESVWGYQAASGLKTLTVCIQRLRAKLEREPQRPQIIVTIRGFGYRLQTTHHTAGHSAALPEAPPRQGG